MVSQSIQNQEPIINNCTVLLTSVFVAVAFLFSDFSFFSEYQSFIITLDSYCLHLSHSLTVRSYCFFFLKGAIGRGQGISIERPLIILGLFSAGG